MEKLLPFLNSLEIQSSSLGVGIEGCQLLENLWFFNCLLFGPSEDFEGCDRDQAEGHIPVSNR